MLIPYYQLRSAICTGAHPHPCVSRGLIPPREPALDPALGYGVRHLYHRRCGSESGASFSTLHIHCTLYTGTSFGLIYDAIKSDDPVCPPQGSRDRSGDASPLQCTTSQSRQKSPAAASAPSQCGASCSRQCRRSGPPRNVRSLCAGRRDTAL